VGRRPSSSSCDGGIWRCSGDSCAAAPLIFADAGAPGSRFAAMGLIWTRADRGCARRASVTCFVAAGAAPVARQAVRTTEVWESPARFQTEREKEGSNKCGERGEILVIRRWVTPNQRLY
jgi:hypothetical protein